MITEAIEIYRSRRLGECEEHAFVLTAVGIPSEITREGDNYVLWVDVTAAGAAGAHLARYHAESRPTPPAPPAPEFHRGAWIGCMLYILTLLAVAQAIGGGFGRLDAFEVGMLDSARVQNGEWWRAWTALTLHADADHLVANLGAGVWFGFLAGRHLGSGIAWLLIVCGAAMANLAEALLGPAAHRSVGASTAVFAALGVLAACTWRERFRLTERWAVRWGPLVVGIILLGWFGSQGENTDVVAHVAGFGFGALLGAFAGSRWGRRVRSRVPQWLAGAVALGSIVVAWTCAQLS